MVIGLDLVLRANRTESHIDCQSGDLLVDTAICEANARVLGLVAFGV